MTHPPAPEIERTDAPLAGWIPPLALACGVLVAYGSLVPLDFRPVSFAAAWQRFSNIPYLAISAGGRADWVANILLFIPLAFLWCARSTGGKPSRGLKVVPVFVGCLLFAVALEFGQVWFAPRTVSINDILAEWIGSAIGVAIWLVRGPALLRVCAVIAGGGTAGLVAGLSLYAGAYVLYTLMPFDFVISTREIESLIRRHGGVMPFVSPRCGDVVRCGAKSMVEVASFIPMGFLLVLIATNRRRLPPRLAAGAAIGALAALLIEASQIFIVSAVAQWLSVLTRTIGMTAGIYLGRSWNPALVAKWVRIVPSLLIVAGTGYLLAVVVVIWHGGWKLEGGLARIGTVNWLPFYYHYWTTEQAAVVSVIFNAMLYAPIGAGFWLRRFWESGGHRTELRGAGRAAAAAVLFAAIVEAARLFKATAHPDPTNILIAAAAAALAFRGLGWCAGCLLPDAPRARARRRPIRDGAHRGPAPSRLPGLD